MACCSLACSRRTAISSSLMECTVSADSACVEADLCPSFSASASRSFCSRRSPAVFRPTSNALSLSAIMFVLPHEFVADSMHGQEEPGLLRNWFKLLANAHNVSVHGARGGKILIAPDFVEKAVAAHRLSGMTEKMFQQLKLFARKLNGLAAAQDLVAAQVHVDIAERVTVLLFRQRLRAAQNGLHASEQFADGEGLGYIVVSAEFKPHNLIHFLAARREHDDGNRWALRL